MIRMKRISKFSQVLEIPILSWYNLLMKYRLPKKLNLFSKIWRIFKWKNVHRLKIKMCTCTVWSEPSLPLWGIHILWAFIQWKTKMHKTVSWCEYSMSEGAFLNVVDPCCIFGPKETPHIVSIIYHRKANKYIFPNIASYFITKSMKEDGKT